MKNKIDTLHEKAEECRLEAQVACNDSNRDAEAQAVVDFETGEVAQYFRDNADYVTGLVIQRLNDVKEGKPTFPIRAFDAETLVRLMSSDTLADCDLMFIRGGLSDQEVIAAAEAGNLAEGGYFLPVETLTTKMQDKLYAALLEYARTAASFAKEIASASLLDWAGIIDICENLRIGSTSRIREEDALRLIALEKSAADRLRLDVIIAGLPPFKADGKQKKTR